MALTSVVDQLWCCSIPIDEKRRLAMGAVQLALGMGTPAPAQPGATQGPSIGVVAKALRMVRAAAADGNMNVGGAVRWLKGRGGEEVARRLRRQTSIRNAEAHPEDVAGLINDLTGFLAQLRGGADSGKLQNTDKENVNIEQRADQTPVAGGGDGMGLPGCGGPLLPSGSAGGGTTTDTGSVDAGFSSDVVSECKQVPKAQAKSAITKPKMKTSESMDRVALVSRLEAVQEELVCILEGPPPSSKAEAHHYQLLVDEEAELTLQIGEG